MFSQCDVNNSGKLTLKEVTDCLSRVGKSHYKDAIEYLWNDIAGGDGLASRDEIAIALKYL